MESSPFWIFEHFQKISMMEEFVYFFRHFQRFQKISMMEDSCVVYGLEIGRRGQSNKFLWIFYPSPSSLAQPYFSNLEFYIDQELDYECSERCQITTTTNLTRRVWFKSLTINLSLDLIAPRRIIFPFNSYFKKPSNLPFNFLQIVTKRVQIKISSKFSKSSRRRYQLITRYSHFERERETRRKNSVFLNNIFPPHFRYIAAQYVHFDSVKTIPLVRYYFTSNVYNQCPSPSLSPIIKINFFSFGGQERKRKEWTYPK